MILATKLLGKSRKWKKKASKSVHAQKLVAIQQSIQLEKERQQGADDEEDWQTVPDEGELTEDEGEIADNEDRWIQNFKMQQRSELWIGKKLVEAKDTNNFAALHWPMHARLAGTEPLSGLCLGHARTDAQDHYGSTPSLACQKGHK